ncbi:uncharacterized protein NECHADRAFT_89333 [Fusarium vanettenii 77-13-4]|uniref:Uncharacterized protein n=1 Tax=Fusarium vanettenii (strain ATCC MYA-4622 / CBS 123669 / FGSC 9596 / NRRL 45880 / 77-13-4) TaxID=660122 RepID=C7ZQV4_FUSV7|nr:uncharacterized protein NECHADRAFT_89333 [Fusarium vanettenii 77-13-4]EEU33599.1 predicted protein [Fusarium vanettenii 77-13-4]
MGQTKPTTSMSTPSSSKQDLFEQASYQTVARALAKAKFTKNDFNHLRRFRVFLLQNPTFRHKKRLLAEPGVLEDLTELSYWEIDEFNAFYRDIIKRARREGALPPDDELSVYASSTDTTLEPSGPTTEASNTDPSQEKGKEPELAASTALGKRKTPNRPALSDPIQSLGPNTPDADYLTASTFRLSPNPTLGRQNHPRVHQPSARTEAPEITDPTARPPVPSMNQSDPTAGGHYGEANAGSGRNEIGNRRLLPAIPDGKADDRPPRAKLRIEAGGCGTRWRTSRSRWNATPSPSSATGPASGPATGSAPSPAALDARTNEQNPIFGTSTVDTTMAELVRAIPRMEWNTLSGAASDPPRDASNPAAIRPLSRYGLDSTISGASPRKLTPPMTEWGRMATDDGTTNGAIHVIYRKWRRLLDDRERQTYIASISAFLDAVKTEFGIELQEALEWLDQAYFTLKDVESDRPLRDFSARIFDVSRVVGKATDLELLTRFYAKLHPELRQLCRAPVESDERSKYINIVDSKRKTLREKLKAARNGKTGNGAKKLQYSEKHTYTTNERDDKGSEPEDSALWGNDRPWNRGYRDRNRPPRS